MGRIGPDYEIIHELRRGPWVTVYEARHRVLGRRTLIKWLNPEHRGDDEMAGRLRREARLGASVDHPNAARIYGVGEADGRPFVAIEWIEGEDLETVLRREGALALPRVIRLAKDLLSGLAAIHEAGVVHRDLSPANVRITSDGLARITDFGLATGRYDPRFTLPGSVVGTPGYLAPEQASGKEIDARADLFALGVLIHEALTGEVLFRDKDLIATLKRVRTEQAPDLDTLVEDLPEGFSDWVAKCLAKKPDDRWSSAQEALEALSELTEAHPEEPVIPPPPRRKKPYWITIPATLLPAVAAALLIATLIQVLRPTPQAPIQPPGLVPGTHFDTTAGAGEAVESGPDGAETRPADEESAVPRDTVFTGMRTPDTVKREETASPPREKEKPRPSPRVQSKEKAVPERGEKETVENPPREGVLVIRTRPWAEVYVNDRRMGVTPDLAPLSLKSGKVRMTLINPGFPPIPIDTTVFPHDTTRLILNLKDRVTSLRIRAIPWAKVYIDDVPKGDTPLGRPLYLTPGRHLVRLTHPEFGEVSYDLVAKPGESVELKVNMAEEGTSFASPDSVR